MTPLSGGSGTFLSLSSKCFLKKKVSLLALPALCLHFTLPASLPKPPILTPVLQKANTASRGFKIRAGLGRHSHPPGRASGGFTLKTPSVSSGTAQTSPLVTDLTRRRLHVSAGGRSPEQHSAVLASEHVPGARCLRAEHALRLLASSSLLVVNKLSASEQNPGRDSKNIYGKKTEGFERKINLVNWVPKPPGK